MELPVEHSLQPVRGRNYEGPPWCYLLWGVPAIILVAADAAYGASALSSITTGILFVLAVAWIGIGCFINGRTCGRVHCRIDGIAFPILGAVGVLNLLGIAPFAWNLFLLAFLIILAASFVPEMFWKRYA
jgi:hypothetical protein